MYSKQNEKKGVLFNRVYPVKCEAIFNRVKKALITPIRSFLPTGQAGITGPRNASQRGRHHRHHRLHPVRYIKTEEKLLDETHS